MYEYEKPYVELLVIVPNEKIMDGSLGFGDDEDAEDW